MWGWNSPRCPSQPPYGPGLEEGGPRGGCRQRPERYPGELTARGDGCLPSDQMTASCRKTNTTHLPSRPSSALSLLTGFRGRVGFPHPLAIQPGQAFHLGLIAQVCSSAGLGTKASMVGLVLGERTDAPSGFESYGPFYCLLYTKARGPRFQSGAPP